MVIILGDIIKRRGGARYSLSGNDIIAYDFAGGDRDVNAPAWELELGSPEELLLEARTAFAETQDRWLGRLRSAHRWRKFRRLVSAVLEPFFG
jgi:hypothetical protein